VVSPALHLQLAHLVIYFLLYQDFPLPSCCRKCYQGGAQEVFSLPRMSQMERVPNFDLAPVLGSGFTGKISGDGGEGNPVTSRGWPPRFITRLDAGAI
jgi:hypothetical protein